ncbi:MAG TPA: hypothetical protein DCE56_14150 [Cyanobacteria bacterium UBA8553]|nr:hypothetical protein [Cyanobacteria bacterium UBA8553]
MQTLEPLSQDVTVKNFLKELIEDLLDVEPLITFYTLSKLPGGSGEKTLYANQAKQLVIWSLLSDELIAAITELLLSNAIAIEPVLHNWAWFYEADSIQNVFSIARSDELYKGYEEPHWVPYILVKGKAVKRKSQIRNSLNHERCMAYAA